MYLHGHGLTPGCVQLLRRFEQPWQVPLASAPSVRELALLGLQLERLSSLHPQQVCLAAMHAPGGADLFLNAASLGQCCLSWAALLVLLLVCCWPAHAAWGSLRCLACASCSWSASAACILSRCAGMLRAGACMTAASQPLSVSRPALQALLLVCCWAACAWCTGLSCWACSWNTSAACILSRSVLGQLCAVCCCRNLSFCPLCELCHCTLLCTHALCACSFCA